MATYYVSTDRGDDADNGTSEATPKATLAATIALGTSDGDIVEIIDEGSYNEGDLQIQAEITVQHTASSLGRPKIYGTGLGGNDAVRAFDSEDIGPILKGLEIYGYSGKIFQSTARKGIEIEDCFIHDVPQLINNTLIGVADNPNIIKQSILFFEPAGAQAINNGVDDTNGWLQIENCLITSSNTSGDNPIIYDYSNHGTASFCTIINRGATDKSTIVLSKVINCYVSASDGYGIASDDRTYNTVCVEYAGADKAFRNKDDDSDGAAGAGEQAITDAQSYAGFVAGRDIGDADDISDSFQLTSLSLAIDAGTAYNNIFVDFEDIVRPCRGYDVGCFEYTTDWSEYTAEPKSSFDNGLAIQSNANLSSNHKFKYCSFNRQAPFSLGVKGPANLRGRTTAYKVER